MTTVRPLIVGDRTILVEIQEIDLQLPSDSQGEAAGFDGAAALDKIGDLKDEVAATCIAVYESVKKAAETVQPDEISVEFGLTLGGEAGIPFVAKGKIEANLGITLTWKLANGTIGGPGTGTPVIVPPADV